MKHEQSNPTSKPQTCQQVKPTDIAVVGMSLRFPGADNKTQFWHNLVNKVSSINEVPTDRWDWRECYDPMPKKDAQKSLSKWGGFIDDIDGFDAAFFAISPTEAKNMDPQQRLALQLAWQCFEDAGIAPSTLKNSKTGVYVGCSNTDYQEFSTGNIEPHFLTGMSTGVFANRISHFFNFHGPSLTIDTACSSSLVAIHKAVKDFQMGEISAALVGGVNLLITPSRYISFSKLGVLSPTGQCKTLDADADGYVRGEGVGMVLLLPIEQALEQNATIYGIIKGSSVSHSGKTKTLTSPNPFSQSRAIQEAQEGAGITSNQVGYIELHGTGTRLGDPIEIQGLKRAFRATKGKSADQHSCYLSTVKTNIGHLESAAGIAGVIKTLLCFENNKIAPLQNFEQLNPKISLDKSPLKLATEPQDWTGEDRIAGISSFGFAGVNAHVILQAPPQFNTDTAEPNADCATVILSAKNERALKLRAQLLLAHIEAGLIGDNDINNLAFTLQVGREAMACRFGFIATTLAEIKAQLQLFNQNSPGLWQQGKEDNGQASASPNSQNGAVETSDSYGLQTALLNDWIEGYSVDWNMLYDNNKPKRISLPGYPFAKNRYWIDQSKTELTPLSQSTLHPLLHETLPSFEGLSFISRFNGEEFFLKDHLVLKTKMLPGVCTLEMVQEAIALSHQIDDDHTLIFEDILWMSPIVVNDGEQEVCLSLLKQDDKVEFELWSQSEDNQVTYAQGQVFLCKQEMPVVDLNVLNDNAPIDTLEAEALYQRFSEVGIEYGPAFQGVEQVQKQGQHSRAILHVDECYTQGFSFSPTLLDAALQSLGIFVEQGELALPFALERVEFYQACSNKAWVIANQQSETQAAIQKYDVDLCDQDGNVCVRFKGFTTRAFNSSQSSLELDAHVTQSSEILTCLKPCWVATTVETDGDIADATEYHGPQQLKPQWLDDKMEPAQAHLVWMAADEFAEPLTLFNKIKTLLADGFGAKPFALTLVTLQTQQVHSERTCAKGAGLIGLCQSLAQEYPRWQVRIVDVEEHQPVPWPIIGQLPSGFFAIRGNQSFKFSVAEHHYQSLAEPVYRQQGVYLVLGGAGGLGQAFSQWMIHHYDAQMIWVGRSGLNAKIEGALERLGQLGKTPLYFSADAADKTAMSQVLDQVQQQFGAIHGVVHSILHLEDQSLSQMTEQQFMRSYCAKQQTGEVLMELIEPHAPDFVLFFSSMQSFSPAPGQSNYAAACHYLDSLALSYQTTLPVKVINWGYWGSVGVVQDDFYRNRMKQVGIGSIEVDEGMAALKQLLSSSLEQIGVVKMQNEALQQVIARQSFSSENEITVYSGQSSAIDYDSQPQLTEQLILPALCNALHKAGWQIASNREQALAKLPPYFAVWWQETAQYLAANQYLNDDVLAEISDNATLHCDNEDHQLLNTCLEQLPQILSGDKKATDVLFPNGSLHLVETVYQNNPIADYANQVLVEQLQNYLSQSNQASVRVLEIGAGTGGTTAKVLPALNHWNVAEYAYTDLSQAFFNHAKTRFAKDYPFIQTQYFDIGKPLAQQGIEQAAYDVVIATNVLHATANIRQTLENAKACLKTGGLLLINEVVEKSLFTQLTFGLLEGWWLSQDKALRISGSPMLSLQRWQQVLGEQGFVSINAATSAQSPQQILTAQSDGQIQQAVEQKQRAKAPKSVEVKTTKAIHTSANVQTFVEKTLFAIASETLSIPQQELDADESYADYGVDSILAVQMLEDINEQFDLSLPATLLFDYPCIAALAQYIATEYKEHIEQLMPAEHTTEQVTSNTQPTLQIDHKPVAQARSFNTDDDDNKIAIVGMSGQFGSATDLAQFWSIMLDEQTSCTEQQRWDLSGASSKEKDWGRYASLLDEVDCFDPAFFSITPQEALYMDPQQRLFLQQSYKALEDANMTTKVAGQSVGVYLGCAQSDYASLADDDAPAQAFWGNAGSVIPARVSYFLNLKGPAIAIDTACSSSLVAIHMACQALSRHEISSALVGGVATLCTNKFSNHAGKAGMLSPDGTCYTFDDRANGFVPGEGVGVLVVKRLADAARDQDNIYGVIIGSGTNQDGTTSGITAPNSLSQEQLERDVYERFNISPRSIGMIEAHGTGTKLGDPIEFQALTRAFRQATDDSGFCALGSVKTNIGHCLTAAGVAGIIKTLLAFKHQTIPASLHFQQGNSHIDWQDSPFYVNQKAKPWTVSGKQTRRAAVSSFGFSGTNAHIVLEEYQTNTGTSTTDLSQPSMIVLSAKTPEALKQQAHQLLHWLSANSITEQDRPSLAYTLQSHREAMDCRLGLLAGSIEQLHARLQSFIDNKPGNWKQGDIKQGKGILSALDGDDFARWTEQQAYEKLLALWVVGAKIDWTLLYQNGLPAKLRLPTYPFAKQRFWLSSPNPTNPDDKTPKPQSDLQFTQFEAVDSGEKSVDVLKKSVDVLKHYTPKWQVCTDTTEITHHIQRHIVTVGDFGLNNATVLTCQKTTVAEQFEEYSIGLLNYLKAFEQNKAEALLQLVIDQQSTTFSALSGMLKTAELEYPHLTCQLVIAENSPKLAERLEKDAKQPQHQIIRHTANSKEFLTFGEISIKDIHNLNEDIHTFPCWREGGVYLITGGMGQLGLTFAKTIIEQTAQATIILVGRKPRTQAIETQLQQLNPGKIQLKYEALDIADSHGVTTLIAKIIAEHGSLSGIIHSAGVIQDDLIANKTTAQLQQVFAPKIAGLVALDEATKALDLDFFASFSSIAAVFGNIGQVDYATANAFVDQYMTQRQTQVDQGLRQGRSLSINWPLWQQAGGMGVDTPTLKLLQAQGLEPIACAQAIPGFYQAFDHSQNVLLYGDSEKLAKLWQRKQQKARPEDLPALVSSSDIMTYLKDVISQISKIAPADLDEDVEFSDMGFDSIMSMSIMQRLEEDLDLDLGELPPTLMFNVNTIEQLLSYLVEHHQSAFNLLSNAAPNTQVQQNNNSTVSTSLALSKAQEGLWLLHKQFPGLTAYHVPLVFEAQNINLENMQLALDHLCQKHPILTVTIEEIDGRPKQTVQPQGPVITQVNQSVTSKHQLINLISDSINQPFVMTGQGQANRTLWRASYWRVILDNQPLNLMVLVFNHVIIDGVSATHLLQQLWTTYNQLQSGQTLAPITVDTGFFDYLNWQDKMLANEVGLKLQSYWQSQLQGPLPITQLPGRQGNPQRQGDRLVLELPPHVLSQLKPYLAQNKINAPVFFLSSFQLLLSHYTRQQDIILGVPVLHRPKSTMLDSLGLFVNQLPLRNTLNMQQSFNALCQSNQDKLLGLINHSGYPFSEIVKVSNAPRSLNFHPVFQMGFAYHNFISESWLADNHQLISALWQEFQQPPELDLSLEVTPLPQAYRVVFKFDASVYKRNLINQLANAYLELIQQILSANEKPLAQYQLSGRPNSDTIIDVFESQVRNAPNATAVSFESRHLSYQELDLQANAFAHHLIAHGVKQGSRVALSVNPSLELIIAILGILKAGAAYVPVDPNSPNDRMQFIVQDAQPDLLVTQSGFAIAQRLPASQVIYLDQWAIGQNDKNTANCNRASLDDVAYIIYTSGSTGKPKGVLVEHGNVAKLFENTQPLFDFSADDSWCLFHSYAFDFSVWEIWGALLHGGKLVIPSDQTRKDSVAFCRFVAEQGISILNQTPSAFYPLMEIMLSNPGHSHRLRTVIFGGEALELSRLKPWFNAPVALPQLVNMYGITETTVHVTHLVVTKELVLNHCDKSIIGQPLPGYTIDLLDQNNQPVAPDEVGEIYVGGVGVTRGYFNRPELTAERFIANPANANERLYRSGDLAKWNESGLLEYVGRADDQVQIRGFRIELGEVKQALLTLDNVVDAAVYALDKQQGKVLSAYLIATETQPIASLRSALQQRLPEYMVPSFFTYVEQFPLTANGKVDKAALVKLPLSTSSVAIAANNSQIAANHQQDELQSQLLQIWQSVLEIDQVGIDDGFFDAGGTSILANVLCSRIQTQLGIEFPMAQIFQYSTIRTMAQYLIEQNNQGQAIAQAPQPVESHHLNEKHHDLPDYYDASIAIVGLSCAYQASKDHRAFWHNLVEQKDLNTRLSEANEQDPVTWLDSWIPGQDHFDPDFFNLSEKNARTLSYSARQLLMHSYKAVEDAGYNPDKLQNVGVYMSSSGLDTADLNLAEKLNDDRFVLTAQDYVGATLNQPGTLPTLVSYHLGFTGPSLFVHSNCSSSLSSVALACSALKANEVEAAIVGAACFYPQRYTGYEYEKGLNFAKDARCKAFDASADGMVGGNGAAVVMLKRAQQAINDGDHIYSLIRGVTLNNDGNQRAGFFAPGTLGQMSLIGQTLKQAGVNPQTISYVEAHGTGTVLGDPIEFSSLQQVYQQVTAETQFCGLGSVKSNLGHTDTAAGLSGLVKTALALHHKKLPASLHYRQPNPQIDFAQSPFYVVAQTQDWQTHHLPRRAAVSSFGIGGSNAHGILEEYNAKPFVSPLLEQPSIIVLSAANNAVLLQLVEELLAFLDSGEVTEQQRVSLAYTLQTGRKVMKERIGFVVSSIAQLQQKLAAHLANEPQFEAQTHLAQQDILKRWIETGFSDWQFIYQGATVPKLSLPTYPFDLKPYPLPQVQKARTQTTAVATDEQASLQFKVPCWIEQSVTEQHQPTNAQQQYQVIFCEVPASPVEGATTHALFSRHFALEQKIQDYGEQLLALLKTIAESKMPTMVQLVISDNEQSNVYCCFHAMLKTAALECANLTAQLILLDDLTDVATKLIESRSSKSNSVVRYRDGQRAVLDYKQITPAKVQSPFKADGVYLLTGGFGGIGAALIKDINQLPFAKTLIATGRKPVEHPQVQQQLAALRHDNTTLQYYQVDVANRQSVTKLVREIVNEFKTLDGVIHAAGVLQDQLFINKQPDSFAQVLAPKVKGVIALDEATQDLPLDFFICFGGLSGVNGAYTQIDYATANAFLDSYMQYRDSLVQMGERSGNSHSIDWPYWKGGGMKINPQFESMMAQMGISPMPSDIGIIAFYQSLQHVQTLVVYEQEKPIDLPVKAQAMLNNTFADPAEFEQPLADNLRNMAASILGMDAAELDFDADLGDLGADSIAFVTFINQLNKQYGLDLSPTLFFKHSTLTGILGYLLQEHQTQLNSAPSETKNQLPVPAVTNNAQTDDQIAIVGVSGIFPQARNIDEFWQNLAEGKDCISEKDWGDDELPEEIYSMGCIDADDGFDPLFFNISPADSKRIQKQESLLMMHVYKCIEDAGYDPASLAGSNTGVFIGCQSNYHDGLVTSPAFAPNRMSYFLDLHGPSEGIDTTCSSSLVAVHKACQAIKQGDCTQAIVGGVNVIDSPTASIALHEIGALSPAGRCKTFSNEADGFVRGEGAGMIFIKPLAAAEKDNDAIYATILGSALNHGGKSQGFTVPNATAQAQLLKTAWQNANIDPRTLSYIECHGTGTSLGDPIEVDALNDSIKDIHTFKVWMSSNEIKDIHKIQGPISSPKNVWMSSIGSVKSNIGHLEIAAGIAGLIKVLMQFKHQTLAPTLHVNELNPYLALDNSPFVVQKQKQPWQSDGPRRAGISSFGISGVNAHVVLQEAAIPLPSQKEPENSKSVIIVLSAQSQASLLAKVEELHDFISNDESRPMDLTRLAYTLQVGRAQFKHRLAWVVSSIAELKKQLKQVDAEQMTSVDLKNADEIDDDALLNLANTDNLTAIKRFWLAGKKLNWSALYHEAPQKLHLPTYPFVSKKPVVKDPQWLLLNNRFEDVSLSCPVDWQNSLASQLKSQQVLLVAKTAEQLSVLSALLQQSNNDTNVDIVLFEQLDKLSFSAQSRAMPDIVFFIADPSASDITQPGAGLKPLYQFIRAIEKHDNKPIEMIYAGFADTLSIAREDIAALLRSYSLRNDKHAWTLVEFAGGQAQQDWPEKLLQEWLCPRLDPEPGEPQPNHVQYVEQNRQGVTLQSMPYAAENQQIPPFKQNGVYLIVGAMGELGMKLSHCLLSQYHATLILLGRKDAEQNQEALYQLQAFPGTVHYLSCDVACEQNVQQVAKFINQQNLALNGIFHLGTSYTEHEDNWQNFDNAMQVKVQGSLMLDKVFKEAELDFFVLFASMAVFGTLNHLSYSYGNGFQNTFAAQRNQQVAKEQRHGKTLAINWGYWHSDDPVKSIENGFAEKKGYSLIKMDQAFDLMGTLLAGDHNTLGVVLSHSKEKIFNNTSKLLLRQKRVCASTLTPIDHTSDEQQSVKQTVVAIVSNVIGIAPDELDLQCDLDEYGFDSIALLKTFQQLKSQLIIELQADAFKNMNTIQSLIDELENLHQNSDTATEQPTPEFILDADFNLPAATDELPKAYDDEVTHVLLTGATGFLGSHILSQLLSTSNAKVYCLVRATTAEQARQRIVQTAKNYRLTLDIDRIEPVLGDMEKPQLGLSESNWHILCEQVQHIVHTASYVNHIQPYYAFKKSVKGTKDLLTLALRHKVKMVHFVSSTTASNQVKNSHFSVNPTEDFIEREQAVSISSGYGQSKWVQEEAIRQAATAGVPYTVYRFSEISGSSQTGIGNTDDIFHRILRMLLSVDVKPKDSNYVIDVIPVDMAAATIVSGMNDPAKRNQVYNVANPTPMPVAQLYHYAQNHELHFTEGSKQSFIKACHQFVESLPADNTQVIMQGLLTQRPGYDEYLFETYFMPLTPYTKDNFMALLKRYNIEFVPWDRLFATYFEQWRSDKYYESIWHTQYCLVGDCLE